MNILQEEHKYDLSSWEGEFKESKVNLFEKKETEKGLHQALTPCEKDVKDEDIKEEFFYIDTNGEFEKLPGPTTVLRKRKGKCSYRPFLLFCIHFTRLYVTSRDEVGIPPHSVARVNTSLFTYNSKS